MSTIILSSVSVCEIPIPLLNALMGTLRNYEEQGRTCQLHNDQLNVILTFLLTFMSLTLLTNDLMSIIGN